MVARHDILAFGAARKACMRPKEVLYQLSNYWWLSRLALHCRLHQASVHQKLRTRLDCYLVVHIKTSLFFLDEEEVRQA